MSLMSSGSGAIGAIRVRTSPKKYFRPAIPTPDLKKCRRSDRRLTVNQWMMAGIFLEYQHITMAHDGSCPHCARTIRAGDRLEPMNQHQPMPNQLSATTAPTPNPAVALAIPKPRRTRRKGGLLVLPSARTGEGKRLREFRAALVAHCGGRPSATMAALIDRATVLQHHLSVFDRKALEDGGMSDPSRKQYLAWDGSLSARFVGT